MAFSAKQKMYNFAKPKKRKIHTHKVVGGVQYIAGKKYVPKFPKAKKTVLREVRVEQLNGKGNSMATKKRRKTRKSATPKRATRRRRRTTHAVRAAALVGRRTVRRARKSVRRIGRKAHRGMVKYSGGLITNNKKESIINLACIGAGFIGSMALMNLAPIPATIKNLKWKGGILAGLGVVAALKVKDKKARLALAGMAVYGLVDLLKTYVPQLASLSGYDAQRAMVLSGAVQSRARLAVGGTHGRTASVGATHRVAGRAMVSGASTYRSSETSFVH